MEALTELCDLVASKPDLFADKLSWICSRCPPSSAPRLNRSHLHSLLALARFLSKSNRTPIPNASSPLLDFLRSFNSSSSSSFRLSYFPQSSSLDSISSFFSDLFGYLSLACSQSPDLASGVQSFFGQTLIAASDRVADDEAGISKPFLTAASKNCIPILPADLERLVESLIGRFGDEEAAAAMVSSSSDSASWDSKGKGKEDEVADDGSSEVVNGNGMGATPRRSSGDQVENGGAKMMSPSVQQQGGAAVFEEEPVEGLERMEIVFRLVEQQLDRAKNGDGGGGVIKIGNLELVRRVATKQLKSLPLFLKVC